MVSGLLLPVAGAGRAVIVERFGVMVRRVRGVLGAVVVMMGLVGFPGVAAAVPDAEFVFPPVEVAVSGVADGESVPEGVFSFDVVAVSEGAPLPELSRVSVPVSASGQDRVFTGVFGHVALTGPGEYVYQVSVTDPLSVSGWVIDPSVYELRVSVQDVADGVSVAVYRDGAGEKVDSVRFTATPDVPDTPDPEVPSTGKDRPKHLPDTGGAVAGLAVAGVVLCVAGAGFIAVRRRAREHSID